MKKKRRSAAELDAFNDGRKVGYEAGVENERSLVLSFLEDDANERERLGLKEEAHAVRFLATHIRCGNHPMMVLESQRKTRKDAKEKA